MPVTIDIRGLKQTQRYFERFPAVADKAARLAVNASARFGARLASKYIRDQVNFSRSYLGAATNSDARLRISKYAKGDDLAAVISARPRATSLARFAVGAPRFGRQKTSPRVRVGANGAAQRMNGAFFVKLKSGPSLDEDRFNVGLAVRLKPGQKIRNKRKSIAFDAGVFLLYGPSVAQVFNTVRDDIQEEVSDYAGREFLRQFGRLSRG